MEQSALQRDLGGVLSTGPRYTPQEETILRVLALIFASSDMIKALSYTIYAIAALVPGAIERTPMFCKLNGFFAVVGVELSDFAVLMIAVHSALHIFTPPTSIGEGGLYPYRYIAYWLWIALPLLMASLAFTNPSEAYVAAGASCSLPVRPFWYLLALSWIPRYLIFLIILSIDTSIYFFIIRRFGYFRGTDISDCVTTTENSVEGLGERNYGKMNERSTVPPLPALASHGLIPETRKPSVVSIRLQNDCASKPLKTRLIVLKDAFPILGWPMKHSQCHTSNSVVLSDMTPSKPLQDEGMTNFERHLLPTVIKQPSHQKALVPVGDTLPSAQTSWTTFASRFISRPPSTVSLASFLRAPRRNVSFCSDVSIPLQELEIVDSRGQSLNIQMPKNIRRQLRFLFVYPLAYLAMWILPLISHALQYNDYYVTNPPFALNAIVTVILISQSTVDCWIFNIKEKPWRHSSRKRKSFMPDLGFHSELASGWNSIHSRRKGGKSKEAMEAEARLAYQRRDQELAEKVSESQSAGRSQRQERSWWDEVEEIGGDGINSPSRSEMPDSERKLALADEIHSWSH